MSLLFGLIVEGRRRLYDAGVFKARRLNHPVISVGNLTVGGTGKTPLVIALATRLRDEGYRPVILSRGYGRASSGSVVVSRGEGPTVAWREAGDEPFLIARRVFGAAVVVDSDRYRAGLLAERENLGDIFLLDDGFQHRRLFRDVDIVAIDAAEWEAGDRLLPWGVWREPKSAIARADAACVRGETSLPIPTFKMETVVDGIYDGDRRLEAESIREPVIAFAGIAKPERFFTTLEAMGLRISQRVQFRDHHAYEPADFARLGAGIRVTTEKDAMRLDGSMAAQCLHVRVSARIHGMDDLMRLIREKTAGN